MRIPIVNEQDEIIKNIDVSERQKGDIGRVFALWVTNEKGEILLAQRSFDKLRDPGKWGPAVAGTVEEGETYEENIIKEAEEEIGLVGITPKIEQKYRKSTSHEYFSQWFSVVVDSKYPFVKQDSEVAEIKWFTKDEILKSFKGNPDSWIPSIGEIVKYFLDRNINSESKKHIIIFSHGFGTRKDDRGLLTDIAERFFNTESILFDYNGVDETEKVLTVRLLSEQAKMLTEIIEKARIGNPGAVIDIIGHSQGCLVIALAKPQDVRKTIFVAPSLDNDIEHTLDMFRSRPGTEINLSGISKLARRDGTITLVPAEFWVERKKVEPIPLYNKLSSQTDLIIINAKQDEILGHTEIQGLNKKIKIVELDGSHQFSGEARKVLINKIKEFLDK